LANLPPPIATNTPPINSNYKSLRSATNGTVEENDYGGLPTNENDYGGIPILGSGPIRNDYGGLPPEQDVDYGGLPSVEAENDYGGLPDFK